MTGHLATSVQQVGTYSADEYRVFLGNDVRVLACPKGCVVIPLNR